MRAGGPHIANGLQAFVIAAAIAASASAQIDPRTAILEREAWDLLSAGRAQAAAEVFREALTADPKNARLYFGAATAAFLDKRDADAKSYAERALAIDPKLLRARELLGQVQHRMGDLAGAIRTLETLASNAPDDRAAVETLARWRREAELNDRMQQAIGVQFTISFDGPAEERLAAHALEALDRAYWRIGAILGTYPSQAIPVVLYTREQFIDITRAPAWAAGAYDGVIRVPVGGALANPAEFDRVLAHEFVHALVHSLTTRGVPNWLNEGLAAALETGEPNASERRIAETRSGIPLRQLQAWFARFTGRDAAAAYGTAAYAVRRLLDEVGGVAIANLLRDVGDGVDFGAAFEHRMQRTLADFQATLF